MSIIARIGKRSEPVEKHSQAPKNRPNKPLSGPIVARIGKQSTPVVKPSQIASAKPETSRATQYAQTPEKRRDGPLRGRHLGVAVPATWNQGSESSRPSVSGSTFTVQMRRPATPAPSFTPTQDILELVDQLRRQAPSIPMGARLSSAETIVDIERFTSATIDLLMTSDPTSAINQTARERATKVLALVSM